MKEMTSSHQRLHSHHHEDSKKLTQRTNASLNYKHDNGKSNDSLSRIQSSSQLQMAGSVFKHYQVSQKENRDKGECQESSTSINCIVDTSHKRCKSYNSNGFNHQTKTTYSQDPVQLVISKAECVRKDKNNSKCRAPSSQGVRNESFDNRIVKKSPTMDETYRSAKEKNYSKNNGVTYKPDNPNKNYGNISDNEGVTSCATWDMRKSTIYPTKSIMKGSSGKQSTYIKSVGHHK